MTPSQAMTKLASILSAAAGSDKDEKKIPVIDRNNAVIGSGIDDCLGPNCESDVSQSFLKLRFRGSPRPECIVTTVCQLKDYSGGKKLIDAGWDLDCWIQVTETEYVDDYSLTAVRCGGRDILHRIRQELRQIPFKGKLHPDFKEVPMLGSILDVSAFNNSDDFQDRAEVPVSIKYCDRSICKVECRPKCDGEFEVTVLKAGEKEIKESQYGL